MPPQAVELLAPVAGWSAPLAELSDAIPMQHPWRRMRATRMYSTGCVHTADVCVLCTGFGGRANLRSIAVHSTRLVIGVGAPAAVDEARLQSAGFRGVVQVAPATWHVIVGPDALQAARALDAL